jgi:Kef-type K+ transport system membrane component KefB
VAVVLLGAAVLAVPLTKWLGLGSIVGYLAAGIAVGPAGFGLVPDAESIHGAAELGVVMLLFLIRLVPPMLAERDLLGSPAGRNGFGIVLFQDLAIIPTVTLLPLPGAETGDGPVLPACRRTRTGSS